MMAVYRFAAFVSLFGLPCLSSAGNTASQLPAREQIYSEDGRPAIFWCYYTNGISDHEAVWYDLTDLFRSQIGKNGLGMEEAVVETPVGNWQEDALVLTGKRSITAASPIPIPMEDVRGKQIRFFVWHRGVETGRVNSPNSYSDPANFGIITRDTSGNQLSSTSALVIGTTGTFPWHCYHLEVFIPHEAEAIYPVITNSYGRAYFAKASWEVITPDNDYSAADRQDPITGSTASNVYYDEMNRQFTMGWPSRYTWNYFKGPSAGLIGQAYDVTTLEGLRRYFHEKVKTDNDHMNHSLMYFASRYLRGREAGVLPEGMDEAWFEALTELVLNDQDPQTGYWGSIHNPVSMGITFHFIEGLFAYYGIQREDEPETTNPMRHLAVREIPRPDRIVETTLAMQATTREDDTLAAWPRIAYNFTNTPNAGKERASLVVSNNAIALLRSCERFVDDEMRRRIYDSIRAAMKYILTHCVQDDGVWLQSDTHTNPSTASYMPRILSQAHYLERKLRPDIPSPTLETSWDDAGQLVLTWNDPQEAQNSVRIYAIPKGISPDKIDESHLIAIIHRDGDAIITRDPLVVARDMSRAMQQRWGKSWQQGSYVWKKSRIVDRPSVKIVNHAAPLTIPTTPDTDYYASALTWYGEESPLVPLH